MAQIFWEQIRNELPGVGEFLTGSLNISGSFSTSGSLSIDLNGIDDIFKISVQGESKLQVNAEGTLQLTSQSLTPSPVEGGIFYSSSNEFYFGFNN
jgi:hypothetical protein